MLAPSSRHTRTISPQLCPHNQRLTLRPYTRCRTSLSEQQQHDPTQQQQSAAAASVQQLLTRRSYAPPRYVGPVEVSIIPGKRFGLTAARNLAVGDLLLVTPPLTVAFGAAGDAPDNEALLQQLEGAQLQPWQLQLLRALNRTDVHTTAAAAAAEAAGQQQQQQQYQGVPDDSPPPEDFLPLLQQLLLTGPDSPTNPTTGPSTAAAAAAAAVGSGECDALSPLSISSVISPFTAEQLQQIISENAYSEAAEDLGAALLRELEPEGLTGLWPEYALLNHSCVPNTLAVCVGQYLLLRVTAPVLEGEELTCSYLGQRTFSPIAERRAYLQGVYGFHCVCERCIAEQRTFPTQYHPQDDPLLGLSGAQTSSSSSSSSGDDGGGGGVVGLLAAAVRAVTGRQQQQGLAAQAGSKPNPSAQHRLLLQQYEAVLQELRPAVQAAVAADSRRQEQQLQLLSQIMQLVDTTLEAVTAAVAADRTLAGQEAAAAKWVLAATYPLLQLQLELIELLLSSGELPVDETQLLLEDGVYNSSTNSSSGGWSTSSSSKAMAAAGAAAAARLSPFPGSNGSRRKQQQFGPRSRPKGLPGWLSRLWGSLRGDEQPGGPVTKRQLLGVYVEGLGQALGVLDAVARGSEVHVMTSIKYMDAVRQLCGGEAEETALAEGRCGRAHAARYGVARGRDGQALLVCLISARRHQLLGQSLARKMSVMAWEDATAR